MAVTSDVEFSHLKPRRRTEIFQGSLYLHYYNEETRAFTTLKEESESDFGGLVFPGEGLYESYSCGYKFWIPRSVHDAPEWVVAVKLLRRK